MIRLRITTRRRNEIHTQTVGGNDRRRRVAGASLAQDIKVGVTVSATGPAASLGIPERNTFPLLPQTIGGKKVNYIVLDDASDTTTAVRNARKLISEDKVDVLVGST